MRAGSKSGSWFCCGTGVPDPDQVWPDPIGAALQLPTVQAVQPWKPPAELDAPLLGEREGTTILDAIEAALKGELAGARVVRAVLEDGTSSADLVSSGGVRIGDLRQRLAALRIEAEADRPGGGLVRTRLYLAEREAKRFNPRKVARRLADRLVALAGGRRPERRLRDVILAPPLAAEILGALAPALLGPRPSIVRLLDDAGRLASPLVTLVDDGRLLGGLAEAPVDGEGMPTRAVTLVEAGVFRQSLIGYGEAPHGFEVAGNTARPSWRDRPRLAPSHLYLKPNPSLAPAKLLEDSVGAAYLLASTGAGFVDLERDLIDLPVCGFELAREGAVPLAGARVVGKVSTALRGIAAVCRDIQLIPGRGFIGSPTLLIRGLEVV